MRFNDAASLDLHDGGVGGQRHHRPNEITASLDSLGSVYLPRRTLAHDTRDDPISDLPTALAPRRDDIACALPVPAIQRLTFRLDQTQPLPGPDTVIVVIASRDRQPIRPRIVAFLVSGTIPASPAGIEPLAPVSVEESVSGLPRRGAAFLAVLVLIFAPTTAPSLSAAPKPPTSSQTLGRDVQGVAPDVSVVAAEVDDGGCRPVFAVAPSRRMAIASVFKLYVLGEAARQVAAGTASWDEELSVTTRWKSKPSGAMRYEPEGTRHTLRYFAERMMAESDNTATDHLIARLGRENVEATLPLLGHGAPELNTPLLMTRELFALKIASDAEQIAAYVRASDDEQRTFLDTQIDPRTLAPEHWGNWNGPVAIEDLEWFASATEVCLAWSRLKEMAGVPALRPLAPLMSLNHGGDLFRQPTWTYVAFKEGSEAGVYSASWLLRRADDRFFVLAAAFNDPTGSPDRAAAWAAFRRIEQLLAETP